MARKWQVDMFPSPNPLQAPDPFDYYKVKETDSIGSIAGQYGTTPSLILKANPSVSNLSTGVSIRIPTAQYTGANMQEGFNKVNDPFALQGIPNISDSQALAANLLGPNTNTVGQTLNQPSSPSLIGETRNDGGSAFTGEVGSSYTTRYGRTYSITQVSDKEGHLTGSAGATGVVKATRAKANYGKRGQKWRTYTTKDADGNWRKVTTRDYGRGSRKRRNRRARGIARAGSTPTQPQLPPPQPIMTNILDWRVATG